MGDSTYLVVVIEDAEYPLIGVEPYDGVFAGILLGKEMTEENQEKIERRDDGCYVACMQEED